MTTLTDLLRVLGACDPAIVWVAAQPVQLPRVLWPACRDGSWLLWLLERAGIDCSEMGFVCAERARQTALRALPSSPERDALARCAPIVDRETAAAAEAAAWAAARAWGQAARVAWVTARAAWVMARAAAEAAAWEAAPASALEAAWEAAREAELAAIADLVRERWPVPPQEVLEMLGGWR